MSDPDHLIVPCIDELASKGELRILSHFGRDLCDHVVQIEAEHIQRAKAKGRPGNGRLQAELRGHARVHRGAERGHGVEAEGARGRAGRGGGKAVERRRVEPEAVADLRQAEARVGQARRSAEAEIGRGAGRGVGVAAERGGRARRPEPGLQAG